MKRKFKNQDENLAREVYMRKREPKPYFDVVMTTANPIPCLSISGLRSGSLT